MYIVIKLLASWLSKTKALTGPSKPGKIITHCHCQFTLKVRRCTAPTKSFPR